jgi:nitrogen fixation NifU-like protein
MLSQKIKNEKISELKPLLTLMEGLFKETEIKVDSKWQDFKKIMNRDNISRKECLLLPFKTISKALKF